MNIVIRVDSSTVIGSGHVMRCIALANEFQKQGDTVWFVCRNLPGHIGSVIEAAGHQLIMLENQQLENVVKKDSDFNPNLSWLGVAWQQDADQTVAEIKRLHTSIDWLIEDHYALDSNWESCVKPHVNKLMVIDDLANRPHECDVLLDQNIYEGLNIRYDSLVPEYCVKLLGPQYSLLRDEFQIARQGLRQRDGIVRRILIFFGGMDATNETSKAMDAVKKLKLSDDIIVDVVVGSSNPNRLAIKDQCENMENTVFHCQVDNMAELIASADLALGAGGSSTWERCFLGLPTISIVTAENQLEVSEYLHHHNAIYNMGEAISVSSDNLVAAINYLMECSELLRSMSANAYALFSGSTVGKDLIVSTLRKV